ncbi:MAG TPA: hypothetical protein VNO30_28350 [Kofleriaceae bacterium]|nr:hypothetical protein [Kofleriaceae bacterium]
MPSRPDIRELASNLHDAFADADRETLLEVLTFVLKEYVVEGPPPMLIHQAETLADLQGASFAQIVTALQTRFDHPELALFVVDGEQVGVRVGGVVQPLAAGRQPLAPAADLPRPAAGVRVVETTLAQRPQPQAQAPAQPAAPAAPAQPAAAPPPVRGLSLRGRPSGDAAPAPAPAPAAVAPGGAPAPAAPGGAPAPAASGAPQSDKPESSGDDASARFSLLELD